MTTATEPAVTPELVASHGLAEAEYRRIVELLGRPPTYTELGVFSVMWSEHCSYKSSRIWLRTLPTQGPRVLQGPGENAGAIDIGDGLAVVFKMESHNHPSFIEPYQGAATGVGGIMRDVFTMGARPVANLNSLRFGDPRSPRMRWLVEGVVAGIGGYGNCVGVPTVGGEVSFHPSYDGNILVNAMTVGICRADRIFRGIAAGPGNPVMYVGSRTGRDGIHGATMASEEFSAESESKRPTVQVGDPFTEKLLIEACLELMEEDAIVAIQDMGAAGLTSSSVEMAGRGGTGLDLDVARVPRREAGMSPYEVLLSESQERMLIVAARGKEDVVTQVFRKWDLEVETVGVVTDTGRWRIFDGDRVMADIPVPALTDAAPVYERPCAEPADREATRLVPEVPDPGDFGEALLAVVGDPSVASKRWVWRQYDHQVQTGTVVGPGGDAAVIRVDGTQRRIALTSDCNPLWVQLDPFHGAAGAVAEAARNLACVGAEPLGITDCLNFGNPERPEIMWQFREAVRGMSYGLDQLSIPVVSGNVSLYNETEGRAILPTPTVGMVGLVEAGVEPVGSAFRGPGRIVALLGDVGGQLGASHYLRVAVGVELGRPPVVDWERERAVHAACREAIRAGLLESAHDLSEGGLAVALAESCVGRHDAPPVGADVYAPAPPELRDLELLFGEGHGRVLVSLPREAWDAVQAICARAGCPLNWLGETSADALRIARKLPTDPYATTETLLHVSLHSLAARYHGGFVEALGFEGGLA
ncbi:phosphoribosylformylglycinamidine synthase subunit PurL [Myxococcota bacterium]|nr:phosphoribosylformylglycinamidine synthase subunit PurL [Myxococcota bacterium]